MQMILFSEKLKQEKSKLKMLLLYVDGMTTKEAISDYAIETILSGLDISNLQNISETKLQDTVVKSNIATSEVQIITTIQEIVDKILSGETVLLIDRCKKGIMLSSRGWPMRGIQEPSAETLIRGARDGFNETMKVNITLIRRRLKDPKLKVKYAQVGNRSKQI